MIRKITAFGKDRLIYFTDRTTVTLPRARFENRAILLWRKGEKLIVDLDVDPGQSVAVAEPGAWVLANGQAREVQQGQTVSVGGDGRVFVDGIYFAQAVEIKEEPMAEKKEEPKGPGFWDQAKDDGEDMAMRLAGRQFVKLTSEPLIAAISRGLGDDSEATRKKVADFLGTELGQALLKGMLSMGLQFLPDMMGSMPKKLAREIRVQAMVGAGDVVADLFMGPLREVMSTFVGGTRPEPMGLPAEREGLVRPPQQQEESSSVAADFEVPLGRTGTGGR